MPAEQQETLEVARRALAEFGFGLDTHIELVKVRENHVFRVRDGSADRALRLHRRGYRTDVELESEVTTLRAFGSRGVPVPAPVAALSGGYVATFDDAEGNRWQASMQEWITQGRPIGDSGAVFDGKQTPDRSVLRALGELMAEMHCIAATFGWPADFERPVWDHAGLVGPAALWNNASDLPSLAEQQRVVLRAAETRLATALATLPRGDQDYGIVHADFTFENVLAGREGLWVLDFDDCGEGWFVFDLATAAFFCSHHPRAEELIGAIVSGYTARRQFSETALQAWPHMMMARALSYLGWSVTRPDDPMTSYHIEVLLPWIVDAARTYADTGDTGWPSLRVADRLIDRRRRTLGPYSPLFYDEPLELVSGEGVWLTDIHGDRYLDAYNNVPQVGHAHPVVVAAVAEQAARLNIHTRYLNTRVVDYAEALLATFEPRLDRVLFTNSGSESNDLALRIAAQHTGNRGIIVSDFSYHGHTQALTVATTGLTTFEPLADHVRAIRIPDLDGADTGSDPSVVLHRALDEVDAAISSLQQAGHGVSALLVDPLFSTEGLNRVPPEYLAAVADMVHDAGGLVIADEVQSGFGRTGHAMWGYQRHGIAPDFVTMGKPMGNGHPVGGVVLTAALLDEFGPRNMYFNTFGGNPVSAAAGHAVLDVLREEGLVERAVDTGALIRCRLEALSSAHDFVGPVKGSGLFFGFEVFDDGGRPDPIRTKALVEAMRREKVLISRIGRHDSVLKMRPPLAFGPQDALLLLDTLDGVLSGVQGVG